MHSSTSPLQSHTECAQQSRPPTVAHPNSQSSYPRHMQGPDQTRYMLSTSPHHTAAEVTPPRTTQRELPQATAGKQPEEMLSIETRTPYSRPDPLANTHDGSLTRPSTATRRMFPGRPSQTNKSDLAWAGATPLTNRGRTPRGKGIGVRNRAYDDTDHRIMLLPATTIVRPCVHAAAASRSQCSPPRSQMSSPTGTAPWRLPRHRGSQCLIQNGTRAGRLGRRLQDTPRCSSWGSK
jgi:hypothetical protein